ncbi:hypothetical protein MVEN_01946400 [Mycena venus]|uniref:Uncharacterized protein n=1 Tax=Mycena venus TaxID=2733690 RepID=A0A8H6XGG7_9AGAR|nr:hypothetical protein MVEN_01946400 [Mycena venus]
MSTSSSSYTHRPALSSRHFTRLSSILNEANAHYRAVAASARASTRPTHHARSRAQKLGLAVNIKAAVNCPEREVSVKPLPVIERSPVPQHRKPLPQKRPTLSLIVPPTVAARTQVDVPTSTGPYSSISLSPTAAPAPAPTVLRGPHVPWRGPTSRFSLTPNDPIFEVSMFSLPPRPAPRPDEAPVLAYPPTSGAADYASSSDTASVSGCASSSTGGSSRASSSGPTTPDDSQIPGLSLIQAFATAKRKNDALLELDEDATTVVVDKRPKYERKSWVRAHARGGRQLC